MEGPGLLVPTIDLVYGALALGLVGVVMGLWGVIAAFQVKRRYLRAFGEVKAGNVEQLIANLHERLDASVEQFDGFGTRLDVMDKKAARAINRVGLVRFNPFQDTGSDLSFSAALLNDKGDGLVLTSLWGREEVRLYAKPVDKHESRYALSQEEKQALDMAKNARS